MGDITNEKVFNQVLDDANKNNCEFLIAILCQGMSSLGKKDYSNDKRNYLIFYAMDMIDQHDFNYILIEMYQSFESYIFHIKINLNY